MTLVLSPPSAWFRLDLHTTGPLLRLESAGLVHPPDNLDAQLFSDEPLGDVRASFRDALGGEWRVGVESLHPAVVRIVVPTVGMPSGGAMLHIEASDEVCNVTVLDWPVLIDRPRPYDVDASTEKVYESESSTQRLYDSTSRTGGVYDVESSERRG